MKRFWQGCLEVLRWLAKPAGIVVVVLAAVWGLTRAGKAILAHLGLVREPRNWRSVPNDPSRIVIETPEDGGDVTVKLPDGVTSGQVDRAGVGEGGWTVEVKHQATDRRGDPGRGRRSNLSL